MGVNPEGRRGGSRAPRIGRSRPRSPGRSEPAPRRVSIALPRTRGRRPAGSRTGAGRCRPRAARRTASSRPKRLGDRRGLEVVGDDRPVPAELAAQQVGHDRLRQRCRVVRVELAVDDMAGHDEVGRPGGDQRAERLELARSRSSSRRRRRSPCSSSSCRSREVLERRPDAGRPVGLDLGVAIATTTSGSAEKERSSAPIAGLFGLTSRSTTGAKFRLIPARRERRRRCPCAQSPRPPRRPLAPIVGLGCDGREAVGRRQAGDDAALLVDADDELRSPAAARRSATSA